MIGLATTALSWLRAAVAGVSSLGVAGWRAAVTGVATAALSRRGAAAAVAVIPAVAAIVGLAGRGTAVAGVPSLGVAGWRAAVALPLVCRTRPGTVASTRFALTGPAACRRRRTIGGLPLVVLRSCRRPPAAAHGPGSRST